ncbi:uncharacterized protein LOC126785850 isoform X7 [Argentina anserina]|uniref:uncharacterized protein LOC126785850 isoform X7 n=1 Tax=Argentina anserina TaxID=57926 RepID=UPI0021766D77|nr:uncharacterized protein LOC126785850 isoform X7 [Potentilla anserina]
MIFILGRKYAISSFTHHLLPVYFSSISISESFVNCSYAACNRVFFLNSQMLNRSRPSSILWNLVSLTFRQGRVGEAMKLLKEFQEKDILSGHAYRKLRHVLEDDYGDSVSHTRFR